MEKQQQESTKIKQSDLEFPKNNVIGMGAFGKVRLAILKEINLKKEKNQ